MAGGATDIPLTLTAEMGQLRAKLATLPGITGDQARLMVAELDRNFKKAAKSAQKAGKDSKSGWAAARKELAGTGETTEKLAAAMGMISPGAGAAIASVGKLGKAASVMASPVGIGVAVLGSFALATGAVAAGLVGSVFAADEALASLAGFKKIGSDFYPKIPKENLQSITDVNTASDALQSIWQSIVVDIGSGIAPGLAKVTNTVVGLALEAKDLFERWSKGRDLLADFATFLVGKLSDSLLAPLRPLQIFAEGIELAARAAGVELPEGVASALDRLEGLNDELTRGAVALVKSAVASSGLGDALSAAERKGAAFVHTQERATKALKSNTKAVDAEAVALKQMLRAEESIVAALTRAAGLQEDATDKDREAAATLRQLGVQQAQNAAEENAALSETIGHLGAFRAAHEATERARVAASQAALFAIEQGRQQDLQDADQAARAAFQLVKASTADPAQMAAAAQARTQIEAKLQADRVAINAAADAQIAASHDAALHAQTMSDIARLKQIQDVAFSTADTLFGSLVSTFQDAATLMGKSNEEAGMRAFRASQVLSLAQATMAAYRAAAEAAAAVAGIPGVGPFAAVAAGALVFAAIEGASIAKIAAQSPPSFGDTPGVQRMQSAGLVHLAEGDFFAADQDPGNLAAQANTFAPDAWSNSAAPGPGAPRGGHPIPSSPSGRRGDGSSGGQIVINQQHGTVVDERVTRFQVGRPSELSRGLDAASSRSAKLRGH